MAGEIAEDSVVFHSLVEKCVILRSTMVIYVISFLSGLAGR